MLGLSETVVLQCHVYAVLTLLPTSLPTEGQEIIEAKPHSHIVPVPSLGAPGRNKPAVLRSPQEQNSGYSPRPHEYILFQTSLGR